MMCVGLDLAERSAAAQSAENACVVSDSDEYRRCNDQLLYRKSAVTRNVTPVSKFVRLAVQDCSAIRRLCSALLHHLSTSLTYTVAFSRLIYSSHRKPRLTIPASSPNKYGFPHSTHTFVPIILCH